MTYYARLLVPLLLIGCANRRSVESTPSLSPEPAEQVDMGVQSDDLELAGTLWLPERTGPVPAVVLVHGSGPNSREQPAQAQLNMGFGLTVNTFLDLATGLQQRGIGAYSYDKRTCGPFSQCGDNTYPVPSADLTVETFVQDAVAACEAVAAHPEVSEVWIAGHSQGGQLAPEIGHRCGASGVVLIAAPFEPIDALMAYQLDFTRGLLEELGHDPSTIDTQTAPLRALVDDLVAIREGTFEGESTGGASVAFWESWMSLGDLAPDRAAALEVPAFALSGDYDWNVPPEQLQAWSEHFQASTAPRGSALVDCVAHPLNCLSEPDYRALGPDSIGESVHVEVIDTIAGWIIDHRQSER